MEARINDPEPPEPTVDLLGLSVRQAQIIRTYLAHTAMAADRELTDIAKALDKAGVFYNPSNAITHTASNRGHSLSQDAYLEVHVE